MIDICSHIFLQEENRTNVIKKQSRADICQSFDSNKDEKCFSPRLRIDSAVSIENDKYEDKKKIPF